MHSQSLVISGSDVVTACVLLLQLQDKEQERMQLLQMCNELMSKLEEAGLSL